MSSISMAAIYYDQKKEIEALPLAKDGIEFLENRLQPTYQGPVFLLDQLIAGYQILGQHDKMNALLKKRVEQHGYGGLIFQKKVGRGRGLF